MNYQWYPGHMTKAKRMMQENIKLIDLIIELVDARIPMSSRNPDIDELGKGKARIILFNKSDLADAGLNQEWESFFKEKGYFVQPLNAKNGAGIKNIQALVQESCKEKIERDRRRGIKNRPVRAMVAGIPNVGKSSLVNRVVRTASAKTGDKAGVTRGRQWIRVDANVDLLDTPGILPPSLPDQKIALLLGLCGALKDTIYDTDEAAMELIHQLEGRYPGRFQDRYLKDKKMESSSLEELLSEAARSQGLLGKEGTPQIDNMARMILADFRQGRLGPISFEEPRGK